MSSSERKNVFVPELVVWLLRLPLADRTLATMKTNPMAFAWWYAIVEAAVDWPDEVKAIQETERAKKISMERTMRLLGQLTAATLRTASPDQARRLLEGYAVHEWFRANSHTVRDILKPVLEVLNSKYAREEPSDTFGKNLARLSSALGFSELERELLSFAFIAAATSDIPSLVEQFDRGPREQGEFWSIFFGVSRDELAKAMRPNSPLRMSGLLQAAGYRAQFASVSQFWLDLLVSSDDLLDAIVEPVVEKPGAGVPARLTEEDLELAKRILSAANEKGVNLLLYGAANVDKRQLTRVMVQGAERKAWRLRKMDEAGRNDKPAMQLLATRVLATEAEEPAVLVVERPSEVLHSAPSDFIKALFGVPDDGEETPPMDEYLLDTNPIPVLWLATSVASLPEETVARFVFHAPLKKASRAEREALLRERLAGLKLTKKASEELAKLEGVSAAQLEAAMRAAKLSGAKKKTERDAAIVQAVRRSQRALDRDLQAKMKPSVTHYSLKYLNTAGRFGPERILQCLKRNPKGALVLYGPPGTGKTQFVEYMAAELGLPLVAKRASDLLSKWLGESEKNIAAAFEEAAAEDAILLLDEGDSFLRDRSYARASWEITQVNELLQHIERFNGIVVVCTNLFSGLDAAALRRFTFKVEFLPLDADQRWEVFCVEAGLKGRLSEIPHKTRDEWQERLVFMRNLALGDFATVKRQCLMLGEELTPEQWLEQLKLECDVKAKPTDERLVG